MMWITALSSVALLTAVPVAAAAQDYPSSAIRIVVGYPPGGGVDYTARLFAERLQAVFGQPMVVENRPGAGVVKSPLKTSPMQRQTRSGMDEISDQATYYR